MTAPMAPMPEGKIRAWFVLPEVLKLSGFRNALPVSEQSCAERVAIQAIESHQGALQVLQVL